MIFLTSLAEFFSPLTIKVVSLAYMGLWSPCLEDTLRME